MKVQSGTASSVCAGDWPVQLPAGLLTGDAGKPPMFASTLPQTNTCTSPKAAVLPLNHVFVDELGHDGDGHGGGGGGQNVLDLGILKKKQTTLVVLMVFQQTALG